MINRILKRINSSIPVTKKQIDEEEIRRLNSLPRYQKGTTDLLGFTLEYVDACTLLSSYNEIFTKEIYKFLPDKKSELTILDCGANIGLATIYFKQMFPQAKVFSFEPDPSIYFALQNNINNFKLTDVKTYNAAVSNKEGEIYFKLEGGHSGMIVNSIEKENVVSVKCYRLKSFLEKFDHITFLKIDIEGHETDVIPDIYDQLSKIDFLFIEYHSFINKDQNLGDLLNTIKSAGLRYYIQESYNKNDPFINREIFLNMDFLANIFCYRY